MKILIFILSIFLLSHSIEVYACDPPPPETVAPADGFFQDVIDFFVGIWDAFVCSLKKIMAWFVSLVENIFFYLLDISSQALLAIIFLVFDLLPAISLDFSPLAPYYNSINYFFPLTEFLAIYSGLITFHVGYIVIKWILKITPFIGGG